MKIVRLEEEVAVLRSRKVCTCGERVVTMSGSGSHTGGRGGVTQQANKQFPHTLPSRQVVGYLSMCPPL